MTVNEQSNKFRVPALAVVANTNLALAWSG